MAEKVVKTSELIGLRDTFGKMRLQEGSYTPGQIDARWTDEIEADFSMWLETHIDELPVPKEAIQELLQEDWQVIDGYIELPTKPGLGFEIDAAEAEQNLDMYEEELGGEFYHESDGSVADW